MIPFVLFAATLFDTPGGDAGRFAACVRLTKDHPAAALTQAQDWAAKSTEVPARHCLALAFVAGEQWTSAAAAFEAVAKDAAAKQDGRAATLWSQGGNAALAAGDPTRARIDLDLALALPTLPNAMRGEAWMDRARADVALDDPATARTDLDEAVKLVPQDPFAWLLSATLARRQNDLARADTDIARAARLAGDDPAVMLEQGNIAWAKGAHDAARAAWTRAAQTDPASPEGKTAAASLANAKDGG